METKSAFSMSNIHVQCIHAGFVKFNRLAQKMTWEHVRDANADINWTLIETCIPVDTKPLNNVALTSMRRDDDVAYGVGLTLKIVSEYDQEIPQSQTAQNPMAPRGIANQPSRVTRKTN